VTAARPLVSSVGDQGTGGVPNPHRQPFPGGHPGHESSTADDRRQPRHDDQPRLDGQPRQGAQAGTEAPSATEASFRREPPTRALTSARRGGPTPSIADFYADLLVPLTERQRKGLIARLSVGYFEGWRPTRQEMAQLVAHELRRSHPRR
jgi:hypothetical protein